MHGHLIVDILTLAFVVVAAVLFLSIKVWLRRRAAAAKRAADLEAEKAAALSVKTQGTITTIDIGPSHYPTITRLAPLTH